MLAALTVGGTLFVAVVMAVRVSMSPLINVTSKHTEGSFKAPQRNLLPLVYYLND